MVYYSYENLGFASINTLEGQFEKMQSLYKSMYRSDCKEQDYWYVLPNKNKTTLYNRLKIYNVVASELVELRNFLVILSMLKSNFKNWFKYS